VVVIVKICGPIQAAEDKPVGLRTANSHNFKNLHPLIEEAFSIPHLRAVVFVINCPGGSSTQTSLISRAGLKAQIKGAKSATESAGKRAKGANKKCKKEPF